MRDLTRGTCWCATARKPCEYHEGMEDALDFLHDEAFPNDPLMLGELRNELDRLREPHIDGGQ